MLENNWNYYCKAEYKLLIFSPMKINKLNKFEVLFNRETAQKPKLLSVSSTSVNESIIKFKYTNLKKYFCKFIVLFPTAYGRNFPKCCFFLCTGHRSNFVQKFWLLLKWEFSDLELTTDWMDRYSGRYIDDTQTLSNSRSHSTVLMTAY